MRRLIPPILVCRSSDAERTFQGCGRTASSDREAPGLAFGLLRP